MGSKVSSQSEGRRLGLDLDENQLCTAVQWSVTYRGSSGELFQRRPSK